MRILQIVAGLPPGGGIAESVPTLCRHLRQLGHEVTLATLDGPMSEATLLAEKAGVRLVRFAPSWPRPLYFSWSLLRELARLVAQAEVVHVHSNWTFPVWWGCRCALKAGVPLVMSPRGCLDPVRLAHSAWKKRLAGLLDRSYLRRSAVVHATAECERMWIDSYLAPYEAKIAVIPNGVAVQPRKGCGFLAGDLSTQEHPRDANRTRTVLYLGRLHPLKGLDLLLSAWERVAKNFGQWHLVIAGPDENGYEKKLQRQVQQAGIASRVTCCGPLYGDDKARAMQNADLCVLPTRSENFGIVVAEALACGVPVITTKGAPWSELLGNSDSSKVLKCESAKVGGRATANDKNQANEDNSRTLELLNYRTSSGRSGWWIDIGVEPLIEALTEALALTDEERHALGVNGLRLVETKYTWPAVAVHMQQAYQSILQQ